MNFDKSKIGFKQNQKTQIVDRALPFPMTPCSAHKTFPRQSYGHFNFFSPKKRHTKMQKIVENVPPPIIAYKISPSKFGKILQN